MGSKSPDEWMTPEFLQALMREPDLLVAMQDPKMQQMIAEVGADPNAMNKYKDDKKLMKFYQTCECPLSLSDCGIDRYSVGLQLFLTKEIEKRLSHPLQRNWRGCI
eukprot:TRINITY_DN3034_c0_g1_i5.p3 TRINITY_DN3034_c0_g1~~TRINITY_DN3034_c0_g1_i5.p3  ORF type:complete len:106 (-),score=22.81 TRINITY_DN3034_c0_g1_i5:184-501(-)